MKDRERLVIGETRFARATDALDRAIVLAMASGESVDIERVVHGRRQLVVSVDFKTGCSGPSVLRSLFRRLGFVR